MEEQLIKKLKTLNSAEPSKEYKEQSLRLILASPQNEKRSIFLSKSIKESMTLGLSLVLASFLLLMIVGGFGSSDPVLTASENPGFDISIGEASYYQNEEIKTEVAMQLQRLEDTIMNTNDRNKSQLLFEFSELKKRLP